MAKEYTKQDIVGYYFEARPSKKFERKQPIWRQDVPKRFVRLRQGAAPKLLLANVSLWLKNIPKKIFYNGLSAGMSLFG